MFKDTGIMVQDPSSNANIIPVSFDDKPDKARGVTTVRHLGNMHLSNGDDIKKLMELYSGKTMSDFLAENPLTPDQAIAPSKMPTESYRFDIMNIGDKYEEKCKRKKFPSNRTGYNGSDSAAKQN